MADTTTATAPAADTGRPQKPDEAKYKADLAEADKAHKAAQAEFDAIRQKLQGGQGGKQHDSRWTQLVEEQKEIRAKQGSQKSSRQTQQTKFDANDREIKALIAQQKDARTRIGFKNAEEVQQKITSLMKQVDSGQLKLVEEKQKLAEVSSLRRQLKSFGGLDELQEKIDAKKAENVELKKTFDNAESRALSDKYEANQKEMDQIKAGREDIKKNQDALYAERNRLYEKQQATFKAKKDIGDAYHTQRKEHKAYEDKVYEQRRERQRQEREQYEKDKRKKIAEARLEEASELAYSDEIRTAENIIRHFDPTYGAAKGDKGPGEFAASAQRQVDASKFQGMSVVKKEEEDFFIGGGGKKKGKGGKKAVSDNKFNLSIDIIEGLGQLGINPPSNQSEVPTTVEKLKEKVENWKKDQKSQTEKNIEKAKKEIEKLEQEAAEASAVAPPQKARGQRNDRSKKVNQKDVGIDDSAREVNVDAEAVQDAEKDGVADATKELEATKIEDQENDEVATA